METKKPLPLHGASSGHWAEIIVKALSEDGLNGAPLKVVIGCLATLLETFTGEELAERRVTGH